MAPAALVKPPAVLVKSNASDIYTNLTIALPMATHGI